MEEERSRRKGRAGKKREGKGGGGKGGGGKGGGGKGGGGKGGKELVLLWCHWIMLIRSVLYIFVIREAMVRYIVHFATLHCLHPFP